MRQSLRNLSFFAACGLLLWPGTSGAQAAIPPAVGRDRSAAAGDTGQTTAASEAYFRFDCVVYPEIAFRNIRLDKLYEWRVSISPALEFSAWKGMKFTGQIVFPLVNQWGNRYAGIRPGFVTLAQQVALSPAGRARLTLGLFNRERWGADLKWEYPFRNRRFAVGGRIGATGRSFFHRWQWYYSFPFRLTGSLGCRYYYPRYQVECSLVAARYLAGDYGARFDFRRRFRRATVGFYGLKTTESVWNGGFYFSVVLPSCRLKRNRFRLAAPPAFFLEYRAYTDFYYARTYCTAPDEFPWPVYGLTAGSASSD